MSLAKYLIQVPPSEKDVAAAAEEVIHRYGPKGIQNSKIYRGAEGRNGSDEIVVIAEDNPETDSHLKQLGSYVAEIVGQAIQVIKEGEKAPKIWTMK